MRTIFYINAGQQRRGIGAVMDIVVVDIAFEPFAALRKNIAVTRGIHHDFRFYRHAALFRFQDRAHDFAVLDQGGCDPTVQQQFDVCAEHHVQ